jgi:nitrilase
MKLKAAAIQMVSTFDVDANLASAEALLREAAAQGVTFAALPENFAVLDSDNLYRWAEEERSSSRFTGFVARLAQELGIWILAGTLPLRIRRDGATVDGKRVRAASILFAPDGRQHARYDKLHLFDVLVGDAQGQYRESASIEPGDAPLVTDTPFGRLGLTVCYDLRFPELFGWLQREGASIITVPSAFTHRTGEAHWETLLRARAIETQCFVIAPGQGGVHNVRRTTWGHSMIVDPWGVVLACHDTGPGLAIAELDLALIDTLRTGMPLQQHKRFSPAFDG